MSRGWDAQGTLIMTVHIQVHGQSETRGSLPVCFTAVADQFGPRRTAQRGRGSRERRY